MPIDPLFGLIPQATPKDHMRRKAMAEAAQRPAFAQRSPGTFLTEKVDLRGKFAPMSEARLSDVRCIRKTAAEAEAEQRQARLDRLSPQVQALTATLSLEQREALDHIFRASRAAGGNAVPVHRTDIASAIGCTPEQAEDHIGALITAGVVSTNPTGFHTAPTYKVHLG